MIKLIRTLLVCLVFLVAICLVTPYFVGSIAEQAFKQQVQTLNARSPYVTLTLHSYDRYWFSSTAHMTVDLHTPAGADVPFHQAFDVAAVIKHGPWFVAHHQWYWAKGALLVEGATADFQGVILYVIGWNNEVTAFAHIPKLHFNDLNGDQYNANHFELTTTQTVNGVAHHAMTLKQLSISTFNKAMPMTIALHDLVLNTQGQINSNMLGLGAVDATIAEVAVAHQNSTDSSPMLSIKDINLHANTVLEHQPAKVNSVFNLNIASANYLNKSIQPITFNYSVQHLDAKAYIHFLNAVQQLEQSGALAAPDENVALMQAFAGIFESGFTVSVNKLYVGLPKTLASSPLSANAQIIFNPVANLLQTLAASSAVSQANASSQLPMGLAMMSYALAKTINAHGQASLPQDLVKEALTMHYGMLLSTLPHTALAKETPEALADSAYNYLVTNHMFIPNNDGSVTINVTFDHNGLLINGQSPALELPMPTLGNGE